MPGLSILAIVVAIVIVVELIPFSITALLIAIAITNTINTISHAMNLIRHGGNFFGSPESSNRESDLVEHLVVCDLC